MKALNALKNIKTIREKHFRKKNGDRNVKLSYRRRTAEDIKKKNG